MVSLLYTRGLRKKDMQERERNSAIPECIGVIMDGNRRWAKEKGLPTLEGHRQGFNKFKEVGVWAKEAGIKHLIFYAFSTENWNRSEEEVSYLLDLFTDAIGREAERLKEENARMLFIGELNRFPEALQELMEQVARDSANNTGITVTIALSYGGRAEITHAINGLLAEGRGSITEEEFSRCLWTKDIPDPDIIIRTGGEKRLSNFLPYQSVYSELFFSDTYWPDFSKEEFLGILDEFSRRERRRGK